LDSQSYHNKHNLKLWEVISMNKPHCSPTLRGDQLYHIFNSLSCHESQDQTLATRGSTSTVEALNPLLSRDTLGLHDL